MFGRKNQTDKGRAQSAHKTAEQHAREAAQEHRDFIEKQSREMAEQLAAQVASLPSGAAKNGTLWRLLIDRERKTLAAIAAPSNGLSMQTITWGGGSGLPDIMPISGTHANMIVMDDLPNPPGDSEVLSAEYWKARAEDAERKLADETAALEEKLDAVMAENERVTAEHVRLLSELGDARRAIMVLTNAHVTQAQYSRPPNQPRFLGSDTGVGNAT